MPSEQDAEHVDQFVSRDDTADPSCHAAVTTPMAQQPAPLLPLVISQPVPSEQPQQAPISSEWDEMFKNFKNLQKYAHATHKDVVKMGQDNDQIILVMQELIDE